MNRGEKVTRIDEATSEGCGLDAGQRQALIAALREAESGVEGVVRELAALRPLEYDRRRLAEAKRMGVRVGTLDAAVQKARAAARVRKYLGADAEAAGRMVLADIRRIFEESGVERMLSMSLAEDLAALEFRPWGDWNGGMPITASGLAGLLRPFGISSRQMRLGGRPRRGYEAADFREAWKRYTPETGATPLQASNDVVFSMIRSVTDW